MAPRRRRQIATSTSKIFARRFQAEEVARIRAAAALFLKCNFTGRRWRDVRSCLSLVFFAVLREILRRPSQILTAARSKKRRKKETFGAAITRVLCCSPVGSLKTSTRDKTKVTARFRASRKLASRSDRAEDFRRTR